jgi:hypothetical protein
MNKQNHRWNTSVPVYIENTNIHSNSQFILSFLYHFKLYLHWANSLLTEVKQSIRGLTELQNGLILATIVDILWPPAKLNDKIEVRNQQRWRGEIIDDVLPKKLTFLPNVCRLDLQLRRILQLLAELVDRHLVCVLITFFKTIPCIDVGNVI